MPIFNPTFSSKLPEVPTSIFSVMSAWAHQENALNLAQGFPDFESDPKLIELVNKAMLHGNNQYAPMPGIYSLRKAISEKIENFIELLFNKPPEPDNSTMSFKDKLFYYEKAQNLGSELFSNIGDFQELEFEHDLNNAEKSLISDAINLVNSQSKDLFEKTTEEFNEVQIKLSELNKTLSKVDADLEDELILEYSSKKDTAEYNTTENNRKIGENNQQITKLKRDIVRLNQQLQTLVKKVDVNAQNKLKIKESQKYIDVLNSFLDEQKSKHKDSLEKTILNELKILMHKLGSEENNSKFIEDVKAKKEGVRLMGFGHRVYKNYDPRATVMKKTADEVLKAVGKEDEPMFKLASPSLIFFFVIIFS